jgi:hypothetical protein
MKFLIDRMKKRVVFDKKHHFSDKYRQQALSGNCLYVKLNANCKQGRSTNPGMNINTHAHQNTCTCPACQPEKMPSKRKISVLAMRRKTCN